MTSAFAKTRDRLVVVGAGVAGLAAAMRLSRLGFQVTLLERHDSLGGKIRTTPSAAGPVDTGPTVLTMRHVFDQLFEDAGTRLEDHVELIPQDTLARHFWSDGSQLDLFADLAQSRDAVAQFAGAADARAFDRFCARTKELFEAFDMPVMQSGAPKLATLTAHVLKTPRLIRHMSPLQSMSGALARTFTDPRLRQLFGRYSTYVGGAPHLSPAVLTLIWQAEAAGVWAIKGGMHALATAMVAQCEALGVHIRPSSHVAEITRSATGVDGVVLADGARIDADVIVHAGDPRALAAGAFGPDVGDVAGITLKAPRSYSARVHSFAAKVQGPALAHHNVFFADTPNSEFHELERGKIPADPTLYLCAQDRGMPQAPQSAERFEIIANAPATYSITQPEDLSQWHHRIMTRMKGFNVTFDPTPQMDTVTTPQNFAQMFPETLGALYGQTPHGLMAAFQRPTARTKIPGLYLCGGGTHPGAGVAMATLSARHVAEAIWSDRTSISTLAPTATRGGMSTA